MALILMCRQVCHHDGSKVFFSLVFGGAGCAIRRDTSHFEKSTPQMVRCSSRANHQVLSPIATGNMVTYIA
jgi:hypothetical protein